MLKVELIKGINIKSGQLHEMSLSLLDSVVCYLKRKKQASWSQTRNISKTKDVLHFIFPALQ